MLIAAAFIVVGALAIGIAGGIHAGRTHQLALPVIWTVGSYYVLIGTPWALLLMESDGNTLRAFAEAFVALAKSLLLLGLVPLLITFAISYAASR
ncbi:MAG: hypothetical protein M3O62_06465 [Pseudomonadota bacterium]|nr:hypothetical protein [Pseudomonadota bacterium]